MKDTQKSSVNILRSYIIATAFIIVFALVYNHFGHGVQSFYMNYAWIWPAAGCSISLAFIAIGETFSEPGRIFLACGLATLTVGFILEGIFEIAGTNSPFVPVFFVAGGVLCVLAGVAGWKYQ